MVKVKLSPFTRAFKLGKLDRILQISTMTQMLNQLNLCKTRYFSLKSANVSIFILVLKSINK